MGKTIIVVRGHMKNLDTLERQCNNAVVAQMVERRPEESGVIGSSPINSTNADLAEWHTRLSKKQNFVGSTPTVCTKWMFG